MSRIATVEAPSNIAFIKYWGTRDAATAMPLNPSISMSLSRCVTRTTVEPLSAGDDELWIDVDGTLQPATGAFRDRALAHMGRLREWAEFDGAFRVATRNSFPAAAGIASSASGFAALTLAVLAALELEPTAQERSTLARLSGSGSAARSVFGGYVEWPAADDPEAAYAQVLEPAGHWKLCDLIALVEGRPKEVSSLEGHRRAPSSPHFARRQTLLPERLERVRAAIRDRDLEALGPVLEEDAVELHLVAMSSRPPIFYWRPATLDVLAAVRSLRTAGVGAWMTMDAGANVHVLCEPGDAARVQQALESVAGVREVIADRVGEGPRRVAETLLELPRGAAT